VATKYIIDTHTLLWYIANDPLLGSNAGIVLDDQTSELILPAIALAEACYIIERGKVALALSDLLTAIDTDARVTFAPLDRAIIERTTTLMAVTEMHDRQHLTWTPLPPKSLKGLAPAPTGLEPACLRILLLLHASAAQ
jgi:PIN domain nuclease of toxin-antitoxin system